MVRVFFNTIFSRYCSTAFSTIVYCPDFSDLFGVRPPLNSLPHIPQLECALLLLNYEEGGVLPLNQEKGRFLLCFRAVLATLVPLT